MSHNSFSPISTVNEASLTETGAFLAKDRSPEVLLLVKIILNHSYPLHFVGKCPWKKEGTKYAKWMARQMGAEVIQLCTPVRPGLRSAELGDCHGAGSTFLVCKVGKSSSKNSCQAWRWKCISVLPPYFPPSQEGSLLSIHQPHPPSSPQAWVSPCLKRKHPTREASTWLWSWWGPRCFPPGKKQSHPTPGTKMSHYSSENNIRCALHIWLDFPLLCCRTLSSKVSGITVV